MARQTDDTDAFINSALDPLSTKQLSFIKSSCSQGIEIPIDVTDTSDVIILGVSLGKTTKVQENKRDVMNFPEKKCIRKKMNKLIGKNSQSDGGNSYTIQISSDKQSDLVRNGQIMDNKPFCDKQVIKDVTHKKKVNTNHREKITSVPRSSHLRSSISDEYKLKSISPKVTRTNLDEVVSKESASNMDLPGVNILHIQHTRKQSKIPFIAQNLQNKETESAKQPGEKSEINDLNTTATSFQSDKQLKTSTKSAERFSHCENTPLHQSCSSDKEQMVQFVDDKGQAKLCRVNQCDNVQQVAEIQPGDVSEPCVLLPRSEVQQIPELHRVAYDIQQQADEWLHICNELVGQCTSTQPQLGHMFAEVVHTLSCLVQLWKKLLFLCVVQTRDGDLGGPKPELPADETEKTRECFEVFVVRVKCFLCKLGPCVDDGTYQVCSEPKVFQVYCQIQTGQTILLEQVLNIITDLQPIIMSWMADLEEHLEKLMCFYQEEKSLEEQHRYHLEKIQSRNERNEKEYYKALLAISASQRQQQKQLSDCQEQARVWEQRNGSQVSKLQASQQKVMEIRSAKEKLDRHFTEREGHYIKLSQRTYLVEMQIKAVKFKLKA